MPSKKTVMPPESGVENLPVVAGHYVQRDTDPCAGEAFTALWPRSHRWSLGPTHVLPGEMPDAWIAGFLAGAEKGYGDGFRDGRQAGVSFIRNGLHALLGTASAGSVDAFMAEVLRDSDDGR